VRERPGELIHVDVKKLGRIPPGGGHRVLGRAAAAPTRGALGGQDFLHVAIDDASRLAFVQAHRDEKGETCAALLADAAAYFAAAGIPTIDRVMTDNAKNFVLSGVFRLPSSARCPSQADSPLPAPDQPKAERFNRTLLAEMLL
jgi:hypothetical protein